MSSLLGGQGLSGSKIGHMLPLSCCEICYINVLRTRCGDYLLIGFLFGQEKRSPSPMAGHPCNNHGDLLRKVSGFNFQERYLLNMGGKIH